MEESRGFEAKVVDSKENEKDEGGIGEDREDASTRSKQGSVSGRWEAKGTWWRGGRSELISLPSLLLLLHRSSLSLARSAERSTHLCSNVIVLQNQT